MNPEAQRQINELNRKIDDLKKFIEKNLRDVDGRISGVKNSQSTHTHGDTDKSSQMFNSPIKLKPGSELSVGMISVAEASNIKNSETRAVGGIVAGQDGNINDGLSSLQLGLDYDSSSDTSNITGASSPIFSGTGASIITDSSVLTQTQYKFVPNSLVNKCISITTPDGDAYGFFISSNTESTVTIDGTYPGPSIVSRAPFFIFTPVYLGFSQQPWRRVYVNETTSGGIRFGFGSTSNGQNGLLYMDSDGDLYWRSKSGAETKLN